jgi:hypothetical protein
VSPSRKGFIAIACVGILLLVGVPSISGALAQTPPSGPTIPRSQCLWRALHSLYSQESSGFATVPEAVEAIVAVADTGLPSYTVVPSLGEPHSVMLVDLQGNPLGHASLLETPDGGILVDTLAICVEVVS